MTNSAVICRFLHIWLRREMDTRKENCIFCAVTKEIDQHAISKVLHWQIFMFKFAVWAYKVNRFLRRIWFFFNKKKAKTLIPSSIYLLKDSNRNTRKRCGICSKLRWKHQSNVNDVVLVFSLVTLNIFHNIF